MNLPENPTKLWLLLSPFYGYEAGGFDRLDTLSKFSHPVGGRASTGTGEPLNICVLHRDVDSGSLLHNYGKESVWSIGVCHFLKWWNKKQIGAVGFIFFKLSFLSFLCSIDLGLIQVACIVWWNMGTYYTVTISDRGFKSHHKFPFVLSSWLLWWEYQDLGDSDFSAWVRSLE